MRPWLCNFYITERCNARCEFCLMWRDSPRKSGPAPTAAALRRLEELPRLGVKLVDLTGGEPLLHPDLPILLRRAKDVGLLTKLTTNAILYPARARELKGLVDWLTFSLDAPEPELHDRMRGVRCHHRVMESLRLARALGESASIIFTVGDANAHLLPEMARLAREEDAFLYVNPLFSYFGNGKLSPDKARRLLSHFWKPYVFVNRAHVRFAVNGGNQRRRPVCRALRAVFAISPDDQLYLPCYHAAQLRFPIGDSLARALASDQVRAASCSAGRLPACEGCTVWCYLGTSLQRSPSWYAVEHFLSCAKYLCERGLRHHLLRALSPPRVELAGDPGDQT
jgi:MoaA/NifB/PqqE/SkfB family radical SAM enzyme